MRSESLDAKLQSPLVVSDDSSPERHSKKRHNKNKNSLKKQITVSTLKK